MQLKEEAVFTLKFDGKPVINQLGELEQRLTDVKEAQKSVEKGTKEWAENKAEIKQLEASIKQVREEMGVTGMTVQQLRGYSRQLAAEIDKLTPGTDAYIRKANELQGVNTALNTHRQTVRGVNDEVEKQPSLWDRAKTSVAAFFTIGGLIEVARAAINFLTDSVKELREFQSAAQDLSAVTGATGKDLDYLKEQAKLVGPEFGKTGAQMLEAYKLMASAKPELLEQKELLAETTKAALTLADAGKIDLAEATKVTAESLNQFGEAANQANRFINVIAAGAKEGSAEINEMGGSLKASGTVAKAANLSFEQTNAVLQSMSTIALKGEQAGTMLRNVLLKLQSGAKDTNPAIVGLDTALDNVAKKNYTAADMAKLFGAENVVAAQHIVAHRKEIGELTTKLTGTQEAFKQAAANSATVDKELDKMKSTISNLSVGFIGTFVPAITKGIQGVVGFVNIIRAVPEFVRENETTLIALGLAVLAFNGHLVKATALSLAHAAQEKARLIWTNSATVAQGYLNAAMEANPIGVVIAAVGLLVAGFTALYNNSQTVRAGINGLWQAMQTAAQVAVQFTRAFLSMDIKGMADALMNGGKQIGDAFNKGYSDQLASERPKQLADHQKHLNTKADLDKKTGQAIATNSVLEEEKANEKKAKAAEKHRDSEAKKAEEAAKKEADERVKADADALKKVEEMRISAIKDDLEREKAKLQFKHDQEIAAIAQSKASQSVQAVWVKALNEQLARDVDKAETDHRTKHEKEEAETAKRVLDLKIKLSGDEKADKLQKLEDVATAQRAQVQKDVTDQTERARLFKQINGNLTRDTEQVNAEFRRREQEANNTLREAEHSAKLAALNRDELEAGTNAQRLLQIKRTRLDTEYDHFRMRLRQERDDELQRITDSNMSQEQKAAAQKAINDRYLADVKSAVIQHTNDTNQIDREDTERRRARRQEFFSAIKSMMDGDFTAFSNILAKKLAGENKQLTESQKKQVDTIDEVGGYAVMATQALMKLSQLKLDKELANIKKDKETQLTAWKERYDKGLIGKDEYEKGVDKINKDADAKTKQAQLDAFRRQQKLDIAMAIINGAQAALKSLATLGWPLGLIGVAGAAVATGIQIAMIKAQQPPSLAKGGTIRNAGVPDGPRHGSRYGDSGLSITRRDTGQEVAEMEGGEPIMVLSRNTYSNNGPVIDRLLHSSLHRNGAPIYSAGGLFGEGGSYGDYLKAYRKGGLMFADGGWMDQINDGSVGGGSSDGNSGGGDSGGSTDTGGSGGDSASSIDANTQAQIEKSQATMDAIVKNTLATATALDKTNLTLTAMQQQQRVDADTLVVAMGSQFSNLRSEVKTGLNGLVMTNALSMMRLMSLIDTKLTALENAGRVDSQTQGNEIQAELVTLRNTLVMALGVMNMGNSLNSSTLNKTTQTGFDALSKLIHTDLTAMQTAEKTAFTDLSKLIHADLTTLGKQVHTDLSDLQLSSHDDATLLIDTLERELNSLDTNMGIRLTRMQLAQAIQAAAQRADNATNFTTLQDILRDELMKLRDDTHNDLGNLAQSNKVELQTVQGLLTSQRNEQGAQTGLLGVIASKNLSVQTFVNVFNQIDVIANKSDFK